jgi:hypothetical protein
MLFNLWWTSHAYAVNITSERSTGSDEFNCTLHFNARWFRWLHH